jgi:hypothetical protein
MKDGYILHFFPLSQNISKTNVCDFPHHYHNHKSILSVSDNVQWIMGLIGGEITYFRETILETERKREVLDILGVS